MLPEAEVGLWLLLDPIDERVAVGVDDLLDRLRTLDGYHEDLREGLRGDVSRIREGLDILGAASYTPRTLPTNSPV